MLLNHSQYSRILKAFPRGCTVRAGAIPDRYRKAEGPGWCEEMDSMANKRLLLERVYIMDTPVLTDGRVMYDVAFRLVDDRGFSFDFSLDWLNDAALTEILDNPNPVAVKRVSDSQSKASGLGLGLTAGGVMAVLLGLNAVKNRMNKGIKTSGVQDDESQRIQHKVEEQCSVLV